MPSHLPTEKFLSHDCSVTLRCADGPAALELFFSCKPSAQGDSCQQTSTAYAAILEVLQNRGGDYGDVVSETIFYRSIAEDLDAVRAARSKVLVGSSAAPQRTAITELQQPPLGGQHCLEVLIHAVIPNTAASPIDVVAAAPTCDCAECARSLGLALHIGNETRFYSSALYGAGDTAYEQTHAMFQTAETLLELAGMTFSDVMRTWIYIPEMERDYPDLNRARREFFEARDIAPIPASTGIGAGLVPAKHDICLGLYAVKSAPAPRRVVMTTPTLNEAPEYGSDFSRGMRVEESNRISLLVSGTASLDETGETVHIDDIDAQVDRMLVNVDALLREQGASFADVAYAITYLKHPGDAQRVREKFHQAGYEGFPNVLVEALVCRPELLCETELLAILPQVGADAKD